MIQNGGRTVILPDPPSSEETVAQLEQRLQGELNGGAPTVCRQLCDVAYDNIRSDRDAGKLDLETWKNLTGRVGDVVEWLIDHDRY
jgi:hypothetical protein